ncbi:MAG: hypothetical protein U1C74_17255 [Phenylobacterium sp.]|nr:hypothetical protein [Phenylobacterium sp.]
MDRAVINIVRHDDGWAAELEGERFAYSVDKEVARAGAVRRARKLLDGGRPCQVRVQGEQGFFKS